MLRGLMPGPPREPERKVKTDGSNLWVLRNGQPVPIAVTVGQTNGRLTEITSGEVREGTRVVTDAAGASK